MDGITGTNSNYYLKEYVKSEEKERYDQLLSEIQKILVKGSPYREEDSQQLEELLKELKGMRDQGLTPKMDSFLTVLFAFAEASGANPNQNNFYIPPNRTDALSQVPITININRGNGYESITMTLTEAIQAMTDPSYDPQSTQKLGDMLLSFSSWGYEMYTEQLKQLKEQIDIATEAINNLQALLDILNMVKAQYPEDYKFPPTSWDQIPKELQDKLKIAMGSENFYADGSPVDMDYVTQWAKDNPDTYAGWSDTYFKKELGITPDPQPDALSAAARLLSAREALKTQLEKLEAVGADQSEGSPYATIKKVLDEIDSEFPPKDFPYTTPPTDWSAKDENGNYINLAGKEGSAKEYIKYFIWDGNNTTNNTISDSIDKAIQANQNLSSKMSDEIKAKNLTLQTFFDILTQVQDNLNKMLTSMAQKGAR